MHKCCICTQTFLTLSLSHIRCIKSEMTMIMCVPPGQLHAWLAHVPNGFSQLATVTGSTTTSITSLLIGLHKEKLQTVSYIRIVLCLCSFLASFPPVMLHFSMNSMQGFVNEAPGVKVKLKHVKPIPFFRK